MDEDRTVELQKELLKDMPDILLDVLSHVLRQIDVINLLLPKLNLVKKYCFRCDKYHLVDKEAEVDGEIHVLCDACKNQKSTSLEEQGEEKNEFNY